MSRRILWHSNAPWANTGYGVQTKLFVPRFRDILGHEPLISAFYGVSGATLAFDGIKVLPSDYGDTYGNDLIRAHSTFNRADLVATLMDVWVLDPKKMITLPWVAWTPVDHDPAPRHVIDALVKGKAFPVAMSQHGKKTLEEAGVENVYYAPHSPEPLFYEIMDAQTAKNDLNWQDHFVVGIVAANKGWPSRKSFPKMFEAFTKFAEKRKDALLYVHADYRAPWGVRLDKMAAEIGVPSDKIRWVDIYQNTVGLAPDFMQYVYNGMDVLLNPAMGEGFGVPVLEAQVCRTPVITSNWTAMPELTRFGRAVGGRKVMTNQYSFQWDPDVDEIVDALEYYYNLRSTNEYEDLGMLAREWAMAYHPDRVTMEYWGPIFNDAWEWAQERKDELVTFGNVSESELIGMDVRDVDDEEEEE